MIKIVERVAVSIYSPLQSMIYSVVLDNEFVRVILVARQSSISTHEARKMRGDALDLRPDHFTVGYDATLCQQLLEIFHAAPGTKASPNKIGDVLLRITKALHAGQVSADSADIDEPINPAKAAMLGEVSFQRGLVQ
ncbi:MAG: hypothetical protein NXH94_18295 [Rhodobacteraceae bacterium]|uniref:hypothetical protein n=1 Tax=Marivita sp. TaxID=2003365 RepID=UPI003B52B05A|nr:hypothetical protein [Paracoccaceae bacterium]